jgi:hypothetical protein
VGADPFAWVIGFAMPIAHIARFILGLPTATAFMLYLKL